LHKRTPAASRKLPQDLASAPKGLPLTNDGVIAMVRKKFNDATIVKMIQEHNTNFDLSVNALIQLKEAGVSQSVLQAMIASVPDSKTGSPDTQAAVAKFTSTDPVHVPDEIGVYVRQKGELVAIEPEIVN
jgi:hypothetical protein